MKVGQKNLDVSHLCVYLQVVQGEIAQSAVDLGVVACFHGVLKNRRTEGQRLEVVVFRHLILMQAVVDPSQPVVGCPLIHRHS